MTDTMPLHKKTVLPKGEECRSTQSYRPLYHAFHKVYGGWINNRINNIDKRTISEIIRTYCKGKNIMATRSGKKQSKKVSAKKTAPKEVVEAPVSPEPQMTSEELALLKEENDQLKQEISLLKAQSEKPAKAKQGSFWRSLGAGLCAFLAIVSLVLFNISYWTQQTIIDNKQFVATVSPIIESPEVQKTLQTEISNQIFSRINIEGELKAALPENLQFIAAPFASQVQSFVTDKIGEALQTPQVSQAWTTILGTVHQQLIDYIQNPNNTGVITVDGIYKTVGDQLKDSQVGFLFGKTLPGSIGSVTITEVKWLPKARQALDVLHQATLGLAISTVAFAALALALSKRRVGMTIKLMVGSLFGMLITLGVLYLGQHSVNASVAADFRSAAVAIYDIVTHPLIEQTKGIAALLGGVLAVIFVASRVGWVTWLREKMRISMDWLFARFSTKLLLPEWLPQIPKNRLVIAWTLTAVSFALFALRLPPTLSGVVTAVVVAGLCELALEVVSSYCRVAQQQNATIAAEVVAAKPTTKKTKKAKAAKSAKTTAASAKKK